MKNLNKKNKGIIEPFSTLLAITFGAGVLLGFAVTDHKIKKQQHELMEPRKPVLHKQKAK